MFLVFATRGQVKRTLEGQVVHLEAFVRALVCRDDRRIADQRIVDARVGHQVRLELVQIDVERAVEAQARCDGAHYLSDQTVEMLVVGARNIEVATADIVDSLIVDEKGAVRVLNRAVCGQYSIVGLHNGGRHTRGRVDCEFELGLLAIVGRQAFKEKGAEAGASAATKRVKDEEALEGGAVVYPLLERSQVRYLSLSILTRNTADTVDHAVDKFLANSVVTTSI